MLVIYYLYENIKASYEDITLSLQNVEAGSVYNWVEELYSYSHGNSKKKIYIYIYIYFFFGKYGNSIFEWSTMRLQNWRCGPYLNLKETEHMVTSNNPLGFDQQGRFTPSAAIKFFDVFFKVTLLFDQTTTASRCHKGDNYVNVILTSTFFNFLHPTHCLQIK